MPGFEPGTSCTPSIGEPGTQRSVDGIAGNRILGRVILRTGLDALYGNCCRLLQCRSDLFETCHHVVLALQRRCKVRRRLRYVRMAEPIPDGLERYAPFEPARAGLAPQIVEVQILQPCAATREPPCGFDRSYPPFPPRRRTQTLPEAVARRQGHFSAARGSPAAENCDACRHSAACCSAPALTSRRPRSCVLAASQMPAATKIGAVEIAGRAAS